MSSIVPNLPPNVVEIKRVRTRFGWGMAVIVDGRIVSWRPEGGHSA